MSGATGVRPLPAVASDEPVAAMALQSGDPGDLAHIAKPAVALAQWWRPPAVTIPAEHLPALKTIRLEGHPDDAEASLVEELAATPARSWHAALARDAGMLARRFAAVAGCGEVALRLERVEGDACSRFHADYVPLRLITTYAGPGTEWRLAGKTDADPDADSVIHRMQVGHVGLFKGRRSAPIGLLHRSPPIAGSGRQRLVLIVDALACDDAVRWRARG